MKPDCDACQGIEPLTPETVASRPGLPALRYRAGTHGSFLESMIARLSVIGAEKAKAEAAASEAPRSGAQAQTGEGRTGGCRWLRSREPSDPTIAMLDAWATVGDIMTFYQERIANEGYLSTARERRSLHELAHQIGYKLRPALSSSVFLAFDVQPPPALDREVPPAPPHEVLIPKGTQARHIPGPGEQPQVFETKEDLVARPEWNQLKPRMTKPNVVDVGTAYDAEVVYVEGTEGRLKPGEFVLFTFPDSLGQTSGSLTDYVFRQVSGVTPEASERRTRIKLIRSALSLRAFKNNIQQLGLSFLARLTSIRPFPSKANYEDSFATPTKTLIVNTEKTTSLVEADVAVSNWIVNSGKKNEAWEKVQLAYTNAATKMDEYQKNRVTTFQTFSNIRPAWTTLKHDCKIASQYVARLKTLVAAIDSTPPAPDVADKISAAYQDLVSLENQLSDASLKTRINGVNIGLKGLFPGPTTPIEAKKTIWFGTCVTPVPSGAGGLAELAKLEEILAAGSALINSVQSSTKLDLPTVNPLATPDDWSKQSQSARDIVDAPTTPEFWKDVASQTLLDKIQPFLKALQDDFSAQRLKALQSIDSETKTLKEVVTDQTIDAIESAEIAAVIKSIPGDSYEKAILNTQTFALRNDRVASQGVDAFKFHATNAIVRAIKLEKDQFLSDLKVASVPALKVIVATMEDIERQRPEPIKARINSVVTQLKALEPWPTPELPTRLQSAETAVKGMSNDSDASTQLVSRSLLERLAPSLISGQTTPSPSLPSVGELDSVTGVFASSGGRDGDGGKSESLFRDKSDLIVQMLENFQPQIRGQLRREWKRREQRAVVELTVFRTRSSLFGANAKGIDTPKSETFHLIKEAEKDESTKRLFLEGDVPGINPGGIILVNMEGLATQAGGLTFGLKPLVVEGAQIIERSAYQITGKSTRVDVQTDWRIDYERDPNGVKGFAERLRSTIVWCASERLNLVDGPFDVEFPEPLSSLADRNERDSFLLESTVDGLQPNQELLISGDFVLAREGRQADEGGAPGTQFSSLVRIVSVANITDEGKLLTQVTISPPLRKPVALNTTGWLKRSTVRIYANVVEATNGSRVEEVIGNGEGQGSFQRFLLAQPKLTYLPAETPVGMAPELEVRVNSVAWDRAESVAGLEPGSGDAGVGQISGRANVPILPRRYLSSVDDDERTFLTTGDGITTGERLPTGITNVRATYRVGGGRGGNVKEGTITQLASPPLNVIKVRNLMPASGGVDRENVDQARKNVPVAVMALDRLVSVADYESFARKFAGIAKAQATPLLLGGKNTVVVTIAALDDIPIERESLLYRNLVTALTKYADPEQAVLVEPRELLLLMTQLKIKLQPGYVFEEVEPRVKRRILDRFNFERAELGEDILLSDLIETVQNTPGVKYVDVDMFDRMRQFYGTGDMVRKAACIGKTPLPTSRIECRDTRESDGGDTHTVRLDRMIKVETPPKEPPTMQSIKEQIEGMSGFTNGDIPSVVYYVRKDDGKPIVANQDVPLTEPALVTLKVMKGELKKPPQADSSRPNFFPAQLAYFADLAGTILVKEIK